MVRESREQREWKREAHVRKKGVGGGGRGEQE